MNKTPKSREGCARQIDAILASYRRDFGGGGMFGYDWPTFRLNSPERFARVDALHAIYESLPSRKKGE